MTFRQMLLMVVIGAIVEGLFISLCNGFLQTFLH
jgi:hypothetical protein